MGHCSSRARASHGGDGDGGGSGGGGDGGDGRGGSGGGGGGMIVKQAAATGTGRREQGELNEVLVASRLAKKGSVQVRFIPAAYDERFDHKVGPNRFTLVPCVWLHSRRVPYVFRLSSLLPSIHLNSHESVRSTAVKINRAHYMCQIICVRHIPSMTLQN